MRTFVDTNGEAGGGGPPSQKGNMAGFFLRIFRNCTYRRSLGGMASAGGRAYREGVGDSGLGPGVEPLVEVRGRSP